MNPNHCSICGRFMGHDRSHMCPGCADLHLIDRGLLEILLAETERALEKGEVPVLKPLPDTLPYEERRILYTEQLRQKDVDLSEAYVNDHIPYKISERERTWLGA